MDTQVKYSLHSAIEQDRLDARDEIHGNADKDSEKGWFPLDAYQIQVILAIALVLSVFAGVASA